MLCEVETCAVYRQHRAGEPDHDDGCRGCLPRPAGDGLRICWPHRDSVAQDAIQAAETWVELEGMLAAGGGNGLGEAVAGTRDRELKVNPAAIKARADIEAKLASWSGLIASERGWTPPERDIPRLGEFVAASATWIAGHPLAAQAVAELRSVAWGQARRIAYPDGSKVHTMSTGCPIAECPGSARAYLRRPDSLLPAGEIRCDVEESHRWRSSEWLGLVKR